MAAPAPPEDTNLSQPRRFSTVAGSEPEIIEKHEEETPTASHALAEESADIPHEDKGATQIEHGDVEVKNLGWNEEARNVPRPLIGGLKNHELWTLIRRFNKQVFRVRRIEEPPLAQLDMNIADADDFSPEKLRAQLERLYMVVLVNLFSLWKHVVRLRSWKEVRRTSIFFAVYAVSWLLDLLAPTLILFAMVLVLSPESREFCFPPAPPALIDSKTGGVQKPAAGVLASDDSATGAPEKHKGEAVEQEAHSFVTSISSLVVSTAAGKHPQADPDDDSAAPDPSGLTDEVSNSRDAAIGKNPSAEHDRTKAPVQEAVWDKARPMMHAISDLCDTWERFENALSPTAPFHLHRPRVILASVLLPMLLGSIFTSSYMMIKGVGFGVGFGFFGDPIITPAIEFANRTYPRWQKYVELRNTLLRGVPTNAQLTITLLRIGERNRAPVPPPPSSDVPPPKEAHETAGEDLEHLEGATDAEIQDAVAPEEEHEEEQTEEEPKHKKTRRIMNFLRGTAKGGVQTTLTADKVNAKMGAHHAKNRLGVVKGPEPNPATGPIQFPARFKGQKGHAYITAKATTPAVSWTTDINDVSPSWTMTIGDVEELKKMGGLGWKSKIIVGWATGREIRDGLVIRTRDGQELHLTAVVMRDELFNRLISMGSQMWEAW
ncbi:Fc.00g096060.m01.CDS01 [Cosmosporella sp. VM-42]